ncbi:uncharacterized protein LTR77_008449 [Saxophila tyrrhenica]|uniref:Uncharacterized protein n=1 Tax=Saxophila tyrrhenica TaxID=1690608 RepID=A0AAV9P4W7_9PEZI|nr:hypothetical protein LTR77_008449 [Saxophila tyrrhenica]
MAEEAKTLSERPATEKAFKEYDLNTDIITEHHIGLSGEMSKEEQGRVFRQFFHSFMAQCDQQVPAAWRDRLTRLFTFCYFGHADLRKQMPQDDNSRPWQQAKHLFAVNKDWNEPDSIEFDLTFVQQYLRDSFDHGALCIFEFCCGGYPGMDVLSPEQTAGLNHTMFTLSAGAKRITIENTPHDFTARLVKNLRADRGPTTIIDRYIAIHRDAIWEQTDKHAMITCSMNGSPGHIVLQPRVVEPESSSEETSSSEDGRLPETADGFPIVSFAGGDDSRGAKATSFIAALLRKFVTGSVVPSAGSLVRPPLTPFNAALLPNFTAGIALRAGERSLMKVASPS